MDELISVIRQSGDPHLVNAVAAKRTKGLEINNHEWPDTVTDQAQFSAEPFRLYDPDQSKYPVRKTEGRDDYPDFGSDWEQHLEDK